MKYYVEVIDGNTKWYKDAKRTILHREDGPATIFVGGPQEWYLNGERHREDGPAVIWANGGQEWFLSGGRHREDGPAIIFADGSCRWYLNNNLHRTDGPAVTNSNGNRHWYLNGIAYTEASFRQKMNPVKELTVADIEKLLGHKVKVVS